MFHLSGLATRPSNDREQTLRFLHPHHLEQNVPLTCRRKACPSFGFYSNCWY